MADTNFRSHRSNTDLERPLFLLHKIEPTARRSSFADKHARRRPMDDGRNRTYLLGARRTSRPAATTFARNDLLFTMSDNTRHARAPRGAPNACADSCLRMSLRLIHGRVLRSKEFRRSGSPLVEPDGIEPTTSCLQSRRSPN